MLRTHGSAGARPWSAQAAVEAATTIARWALEPSSQLPFNARISAERRLRWTALPLERLLLETDVLADAVPLHTPASLNRLETVQAALDKAGNVADWVAGDREFHEALYAPAARPETLAIIRRLRFLVAQGEDVDAKPHCHQRQREQHDGRQHQGRPRRSCAGERVHEPEHDRWKSIVRVGGSRRSSIVAA